jgi:uncharacterized protein YrrD
MLLLGSKLIDTPIMSLQTGTKMAVTKKPLIDPSNLKIIAYEVDGPMLNDHPSFIRIVDVRELSRIGMIIDSSDEFIGVDDVINIKKIIDLNFELVGLDVIDEAKHKLGKVNDYSLDTDSFIVQQLNVKQGMLKSLSETGLIIHRSQIVEINNQSIIVKAAAKKLAPISKPIKKLDYVNPFRSTSPQPESSEV